MAHQMDHFPSGSLGVDMSFSKQLDTNKASESTEGTSGTGLSALSGVGRSITPDQEEALETDNFIGKYAQGKALEFGAKGAKYGGPVGAFVGGAVGLGYGLLKGQDIQFDALNAREKQTGVEAAYKSEKQKQKLEQSNNYTNMNKDGTMATKHGVVKKLGAITGNVANNMSVAQYKDEMKFSAIAKNMDEPMKKTMLGDLDKNLVMSEYEQNRQDAIDKNMNT